MKKKGLAKIRRVIGVFFAVAFFILIVAMPIASFLTHRENKPLFLFGYALLWVRTGSMEPTIPARSYILVKASDGENLEERTIITYYCRDKASPVYGSLLTHRIVAVDETGYRMQGDNPASHTERLAVNSADVVAVYVRSLPVLTWFGRVFMSPPGFILLLLISVGMTMFIYIPEVISALRNEKKAAAEKEKAIAARVEEEIRKLQENDGNGAEK